MTPKSKAMQALKASAKSTAASTKEKRTPKAATPPIPQSVKDRTFLIHDRVVSYVFECVYFI